MRLDISTDPLFLRFDAQLQLNYEQIFCAAVFQLTETARNMKRYRIHIIHILSEAKKNSDLNAVQLKALDTALKELSEV